MSIEPILRANFVDQAYRAIKQLIVGGELGPGTQIKIEALSKRLGVSASPIREALRRLENERWVETIPFRGAFVRPFEEAELMELYELREILELAALRKVLAKLTPEGLTRLAEAATEIAAALRAGDRMRYLAADTRFHQTIVEMAGNRRLSELFTTLVEQGKCFTLGRTAEAMARYKDGRDQHSELIEVFAAGDRRRALRLMRQHLRITVAEVRAAKPAADRGATV